LLGEVTDSDHYHNTYGTRREPWDTLILPILREIGAQTLIARTSASRAAAYGILAGRLPLARNRAKYIELAIEHAQERLTDWGIKPPDNRPALLWLYLQERQRRGEDVRRCQWCGEPLEPGARADKRYHDECRQRARRARGGTS
jgi:hypothetical protein